MILYMRIMTLCVAQPFSSTTTVKPLSGGTTAGDKQLAPAATQISCIIRMASQSRPWSLDGFHNGAGGKSFLRHSRRRFGFGASKRGKRMRTAQATPEQQAHRVDPHRESPRHHNKVGHVKTNPNLLARRANFADGRPGGIRDGHPRNAKRAIAERPGHNSCCSASAPPAALRAAAWRNQGCLGEGRGGGAANGRRNSNYRWIVGCGNEHDRQRNWRNLCPLIAFVQ